MITFKLTARKKDIGKFNMRLIRIRFLISVKHRIIILASVTADRSSCVLDLAYAHNRCPSLELLGLGNLFSNLCLL